MSYNSISTFFLIVALLYATFSHPFADARNITITGRLCCSTGGNCIFTRVGVSGAPVILRCPVGLTFTPTVIATTTTDAAGNFVFTAVALPPSTLPTLCVVIVQLPLTGAANVSCPLLGAAAPRNLTADVQVTNSGILTGLATGIAGLFF